MPRSGSSMTAGIFDIHGCWKGNYNIGCSYNPKGYFENLDAKAILIRRCGKLAQGVIPAEPQSGFKQEILQKLKPEGKWFIKCSAMYRNAFNEFNPKFICVRRKTEGLIGSNKKTGFMGTGDVDKLKMIIDAHNREMDISQGVDVYTDQLIEGDFSSIISALKHCDIEPDLEKIRDFVEPKHWHYP